MLLLAVDIVYLSAARNLCLILLQSVWFSTFLHLKTETCLFVASSPKNAVSVTFQTFYNALLRQNNSVVLLRYSALGGIVLAGSNAVKWNKYCPMCTFAS